MHFYDRPTSPPAKISIYNLVEMLCWAAVAYYRLAGIEMHATGGPASAPRIARTEISRQCVLD